MKHFYLSQRFHISHIPCSIGLTDCFKITCKEIGRVDELGSGVRNTFKYCGIYTPGTKPEFIEDDVFKTIIPLKAKENGKTVPISGSEKVRRKVRRKY